MQLRLLSLLVPVLLAVSCAHEHSTVAVSSRRDAERLMASIRPGMTVAQMQSTIPHSAVSQSPVVEHGGVWYDMTISDDYIIQFRAAHSHSGELVEQSIISYSPRLRDRKTLAFISGEERPW